MTEFEYTNELYDKEIDYITKFISTEIVFLKKYKKNLTLFSYSETLKGKIITFDFQRLIAEIERISLEIDSLETKKIEYIKLKEKQ